jgi:hypothetical protein
MAAPKAVNARNNWLALHARCFNNNVTVRPSVDDSVKFLPAAPLQAERSAKPFTVGWIGRPSTAPYLLLLVVPLQQLARDVQCVCSWWAAPPRPSRVWRSLRAPGAWRSKWS